MLRVAIGKVVIQNKELEMFGDSMEFGDMNSTVARNVNLDQHFIPCTYA